MAEYRADISAVRNSAAQFLARALELGGMFIITAAVARSWGALELGKFSVVTTFVALFAFAADWGGNLLVMREVAERRNQAPRYVGAALAWVLWCSPVVGAAMLATARGLDYPNDIQVGILLGAAWMALGALIQVFRAAAYAFERSEIDIPVVLVERGIAVALCLTVVAHHRGLPALMAVLIFSRLAGLWVMGTLYARRIRRGRMTLDPWLAWTLGRAALPFGLNILGTMVYVQSDIVLLSVFRPIEEVGLYRAAGAIALALSTLVSVTTNSQLPTVVRMLSAGRRKQAEEVQVTALRYAMVFGVPIAVVLMVLADRIIFDIYGGGFGRSGLILRLLAFVVPLRLLNGNLGAALTAVGQQSVRTRIVWVGATANLLMNLVAIPRLGAVGASATTILTDALISILLAWHVERVMTLRPLRLAFVSPLVSGAALGAVLLPLGGLPLGVVMLAGCGVYAGVLVLSGGVNSADRCRLASALRSMSSDLWGSRLRRRGI